MIRPTALVLLLSILRSQLVEIGGWPLSRGFNVARHSSGVIPIFSTAPSHISRHLNTLEL